MPEKSEVTIPELVTFPSSATLIPTNPACTAPVLMTLPSGPPITMPALPKPVTVPWLVTSFKTPTPEVESSMPAVPPSTEARLSDDHPSLVARLAKYPLVRADKIAVHHVVDEIVSGEIEAYAAGDEFAAAGDPGVVVGIGEDADRRIASKSDGHGLFPPSAGAAASAIRAIGSPRSSYWPARPVPIGRRATPLGLSL